MFNKRRWSDGLHDDFDHLDEFEAKFYCFGGDGGGGGGGGSTKPGYDPSSQEPERGRVAPTPTPEISTVSADNQAAAERVQNAVNRAAFDTGFFDVGPQAPVAGISIAEIAPNAMAPGPQPAAPGPSPSAAQTTSFGPSFGMPSFTDLPSLDIAPSTTPTTMQDVMSAAQQGFPSVPIGGGYLTGSIDPTNKGFSLGYTVPFAQGGEVYQGIGSLMRRR